MKHGYFKNGVVRGSGTYQVSDIDTAQYISDTANKYPSIFKILSNFEYGTDTPEYVWDSTGSKHNFYNTLVGLQIFILIKIK